MTSDSAMNWNRIDDARLGQVIGELGATVVSDSLDLVTPVRATLERQAQLPVRTIHRRPLAVAAVLVLAVGLLVMVITPARSAVASWFGIGATSVVRVDELPRAEAATPPTSPPPDQGNDPAAIRSAAAEQLQLTLRLPDPTLVGDVVGWEIRDTGDSAELVVAWEHVAFTARAPSPLTLVRKAIRAQDLVSTVALADGTNATWIEGLHVRTAGDVVEGVGSTLLWEVGGVEYRIFGELDLAEAAEVASSLR